MLVHFDIPNAVLEQRVAQSQRSTDIFRTAKGFEEVLARQLLEEVEQKVSVPSAELP